MGRHSWQPTSPGGWVPRAYHGRLSYRQRSPADYPADSPAPGARVVFIRRVDPGRALAAEEMTQGVSLIRHVIYGDEPTGIIEAWGVSAPAVRQALRATYWGKRLHPAEVELRIGDLPRPGRALTGQAAASYLHRAIRTDADWVAYEGLRRRCYEQGRWPGGKIRVDPDGCCHIDTYPVILGCCVTCERPLRPPWQTDCWSAEGHAGLCCWCAHDGGIPPRLLELPPGIGLPPVNVDDRVPPGVLVVGDLRLIRLAEPADEPRAPRGRRYTAGELVELWRDGTIPYLPRTVVRLSVKAPDVAF